MVEGTQQVALVTGAGSGIGRAVALALAANGVAVVVSDLVAPGGEETVQQIMAAGGTASFCQADVRQPASCAALVDYAVRTYGKLTLACNNAGVIGSSSSTADYPLDEWQRVIDSNLSGVFYCLKYELPALLAAGGGAIVNIASIVGTVGFANAPAYVASKHGVVGLTKVAALDYAAQGVRVNAVGPGFTHTPMLGMLEGNEAALRSVKALHPMGRLGTPSEIAALIVWLLSDAASFVTGSYYPVDGGYLAR